MGTTISSEHGEHQLSGVFPNINAEIEDPQPHPLRGECLRDLEQITMARFLLFRSTARRR